MNSIESKLLNFKETRRRSVNLWNGIPVEYLSWKPDKGAFTFLEMIRHVLESEHLFHTIIKNKGNLGNYVSPWDTLDYSSIKNEIEFAESYRVEFLRMVENTTESDLTNYIIRRTEVNQLKTLGDYLNRMVYHEAVHTGQMLSYFRMLGLKRPQIWD